MEGSRQATALGRIPAGFLGMLVLVVATERFVIQRGRGLGPTQGWLWNCYGEAASRYSKGCRVLCLGDSQVKHGMVTKVLEDRLEQRTMNLAFSGGQAPTSYFQLRRVLRAGTKPAAVIVDFYQLLLSHGLEENTNYWAEYLTVEETYDLARTARDARLFAWVMVGRLLPSVRFRYGIRELVLDRFKGVPADPGDRLPVFQRNAWANRGTLVFEKNPGCRVVQDIDGFIRSAFLPDRVGNACNMSYVNRFLVLASEHQIPVFWVVPPEHPTIEDRKNREGINDRYTRLLLRAIARFPNVTALDARYSAYPANVFCDQAHLDRDGATTLSSDVAAAIRSQWAGALTTRLVNLPAYRPVDPRVPLEDLFETFVALKASPGSARK